LWREAKADRKDAEHRFGTDESAGRSIENWHENLLRAAMALEKQKPMYKNIFMRLMTNRADDRLLADLY